MGENRAGKSLHWLFRAGILFKGIDGLLECIAGLLFAFIPKAALTRFVYHITQGEMLQDPHDVVANSLRHASSHLNDGNHVFVVAYLLGHGIVKLMLFATLWRERKEWAFPAACLVLVAFLSYESYRLSHHFSWLLAVLTVIDVLIVGLIWHEYKHRPQKNGGAGRR